MCAASHAPAAAASGFAHRVAAVAHTGRACVGGSVGVPTSSNCSTCLDLAHSWCSDPTPYGPCRCTPVPGGRPAPRCAAMAPGRQWQQQPSFTSSRYGADMLAWSTHTLQHGEAGRMWHASTDLTHSTPPPCPSACACVQPWDWVQATFGSKKDEH